MTLFRSLLLAIAIMVVGTGIAVGTGAAVEGCSPGAIAATKTAFTIAEDACAAEVLATSAIPTGTPAGTVAADIELACTDFVDADLPGLEALVLQWEGDQADAGIAPAGSYIQSPKVQRAKGRVGR